MRASVPAASHDIAPDGLPPELMGGLRGVWARLCARLPRCPSAQVLFAAE